MHWGVGGLGSIIKIVKRTKKTADTYKNQPSAKIPTLAKEHVIVLSKSSSKAHASRDFFSFMSPDFHKLWHAQIIVCLLLKLWCGHNDCILQKLNSDGLC